MKRWISKALPKTASADPIWQRGIFDYILGATKATSKDEDYVRENPIRAGLVSEAIDWPYTGEVVLIDRH